jgi:hypothetical protein
MATSYLTIICSLAPFEACPWLSEAAGGEVTYITPLGGSIFGG